MKNIFGLLNAASGLLLIATIQLVSPANALAQEPPAGCGTLRSEGRFGPYDYRVDRYIPETTFRSHRALLFIVENAHFTPEVEAGFRGKTSGPPGYDISYTLHAFPNHHRALISMAAIGEKTKTDKPTGSTYPIECWFQRAVVFRPDDNIVRLVYANWLSRKMRLSEAESQLTFAANQAGDNAFTYHNIGLVYFDMKNYEKALVFAHKAYGMGLGTPTLKQQLVTVGKLTDTPTPVASEPAKSP